MSDVTMNRSEVIVLVDERIKQHDENVNKPKHEENQSILKAMQIEIRTLVLSLTKMEATQAVIVKFAAGGVIVWSVRQIAELIQSFHH